MTFEPLRTARLVLRPLAGGDAGALFRYRSDPGVSRFQAWAPATVEDVETFLSGAIAPEPDLPGTWFQLGLCRRETGELIGDCGLHFPPDDPQQVELGITLAREHQRCGYATEALGAVLDHVFGCLGKHRVYASVDPENQASIRLLERLGLRREAHFVRSRRIRGDWVDDLVYGMLAEEWRARAPGAPRPEPSGESRGRPGPAV